MRREAFLFGMGACALARWARADDPPAPQVSQTPAPQVSETPAPEAPSEPAPPSTTGPDHPTEPPGQKDVQAAAPTRRGGFTTSASAGLAFGAVAGYPNDFSKIDVPAY